MSAAALVSGDYGSLNSNTEEILDFHRNNSTSSPKVLCSVFETASNIITIITGAGMLSLPYVAACLGWSSICLLLIVACLFMYTYSLLAEAVKYSIKMNPFYETIDYFTLGRLSFGKGGDKAVMCILFIELLLALVSFLINIGTNIHLINPKITISRGILCSTVLAAILSCFSIKKIAYFGTAGNVLTCLTVIALGISGIELLPSWSTDTSFVNESGLPLAIGLTCFCFGGHGAL
eukprot:gene7431-15191_t